MAQQFIYQMQGLTKAYPGGKKVFENIWLSFYADAKIGVVGVNGSGKSTLLKIMAGIDKEFNGEAKAADGVKMGYLEQEPHIDEALNVWGNVIAWCEEKKLVDRFNEVAALMGEEYTDELMEEMTALQEKIDAGDLWDIDSRIEMAMDALRCPPNGIVGVIGPNGAGKSTLFKIITGQETPDAGTFRLGETVKLAYVDQSRDALDPAKTVWQEISHGLDILAIGKREINTRSYVGSFNFKGGDQQKKVGQLSGGERNRVHLAKTLTEGGNVILLDEPTNDLDIETLQNLEEALEEFAGCAVIISHDRWFLDRLATHILAFEGDSHVEWFEGNFEAYEDDKKRRLGADSLIPHRIKFQKFTR